MPDQCFSVESVQHRVMGQQIRLRFAGDIELRFTPAEASSLSLALVAVRQGISPEREIYMSPIASDEAFVGKVLEAGISVSRSGEAIELDWLAVDKLASSLAEAIG